MLSLMPELTPAETRPLLIQTTGGASNVEEAGTTRANKALEIHGIQR